MKNIKAVICDLDGTILNSFEVGFQIHCQVARRIRIKFPLKRDFSRYWGLPWEDFINKLWPDSEVKFEEFKKAFFDGGFDDVPLPQIPGAFRTLTFLKNRGYLLGLATNRMRKSTENVCARAGLSLKIFDFVQCFEDCKKRKPDPKFFDPVVAFFEKEGIKKEEMLYVGDTLYDFYAARDAGIKFVAVLTGGKDPSDFIEAGLSGLFVLDYIGDVPLCLSSSSEVFVK